MQKKLDKLKDNIYNQIETFHHIHCSKCAKETYIAYGDEWDAVNDFIIEGWYATDNNCYCPECNKKRNK